MTTEKITLYRVTDDKEAVIEQLPKTVASQVYDDVNGKFLLETLDEYAQLIGTYAEQIDDVLPEHLTKVASTTQVGHVQLNDTVTSTSTTQASTANAVKKAYDRAEQAFLQANDIKTKWASVVGSPLVSTDTQAQLETKTKTIKNTLASNITSKGVTATGVETLTALVNKVSQIDVGTKRMSGTALTATSTQGFGAIGGEFLMCRYIIIPNLPSIERVKSISVKGFATTNVVAYTSYDVDLSYANADNSPLFHTVRYNVNTASQSSTIYLINELSYSGDNLLIPINVDSGNVSVKYDVKYT